MLTCSEGKKKRGSANVAFFSMGTCVVINGNDSNGDSVCLNIGSKS